MKNEQLKAQNYDAINNEGGEGYNPYRQEMERREHAELAADAKAHAATPQSRIHALYRRIERECGSVAREWGNNEEIDALQSSLYAEIDRIKAEMNADFLATWNLETTKSRRQTWNDMVRSGKFGKIGGKMDFKAIREQENQQGWTLDELKKAIKTHNL